MASKFAQPWKMPPPAKVYEALGALGDGRVRLEDARHAVVTSSEGDKSYHVEIDDDGHQISSNDNASYWQGYLGYPAIAVLILRGLCQPRPDVIAALSGVPWKELNRRFRNDYARTIAQVLDRARERGIDPREIEGEVQAIMDALRVYRPTRGARRPPPREPR